MVEESGEGLQLGEFMDQAEELFTKIQSIKKADDFVEFCTQVLGPVERIHFDFKEKRDTRIATLHENDKKNLAKAVSGFANSGGGILIWGFEDTTLKPKPITNAQIFCQKLLETASQITDPIVSGIDGFSIISNKETNEGFSIIFIPESTLPPHRVILNIDEIKNHYFIRTGSSFSVASHTILEDMFGRRPKPNLLLSTSYKHSGSSKNDQHWITIILGIQNSGRGIAKSPFLEIVVRPPHEISKHGIDGNGHFGLPQLANSLGRFERRYGATQTHVIHPGIVFDVTAINLEVFLSTAKHVPDVVIDYKIAAEGVYLTEGIKTIKVSEILSQFGYLID